MDKSAKLSIVAKASRQRGMTTLSLVMSILVITALFSFAVVKVSVDHVKKMQNFVLEGQEKAHVNAALECAIAVFKQYKFEPDSLDLSKFDQCKTSSSIAFTFLTQATHWQLIAKKAFFQATSVIAYLEPKLAPLVTSGNVYLLQGNTWQSATGQSVNINGIDYVKCSSIIAQGDVQIDLTHSTKDFKTASMAQSASCSETEKTHILAGKKAKRFEFGADIYEKQANLNLFKMLFHSDKSNWQAIRDKFDKIIVTGSAIDSSALVNLCGSEIKNAINAGHELIWVEGDCLLDGIDNVGSSTQSPLIVIKNGVVGANSPIQNAKVSLFQFVHNHPDGNFFRSWGAKASGQCAKGAMRNLCLQLINTHDNNSPIWSTWSTWSSWSTLPFYFSHAVTLAGSYLIDIPSSLALIDKDLTLEFDPNLIEHSIIKGSPKILTGSLHDF